MRTSEEQRAAFTADEFLPRLSSRIVFSSVPHAPPDERRVAFRQCIADGSLPVTFPDVGINVILPLRRATPILSTSKMSIVSHLIFNGVCIRVSGEACLEHLDGWVRVELDEGAVDAADLHEHIRHVQMQLNIRDP